MKDTPKPFVIQWGHRTMLIWADDESNAQKYVVGIAPEESIEVKVIPLSPEDIVMHPSMLSLRLPTGLEGEIHYPKDSVRYKNGFIVPHFLRTYRKAVIYTRVSTKPQAKGASLEYQNKDCSAFAEVLGYEVVSTYSEIGSGTLYQARPQLQLALQDIESKKAEILLVTSGDRLVRDVEIGEKIFKRVREADGHIIYVHEHIPENADHKFQSTLAMGMHEYKLSLAHRWGLIRHDP